MILFKLFFAFIQVGLFSVGGGYAAIPLIQDQIVNVYGLMTMEEFSDLITVAEMTPGPISINSSTFVGMRSTQTCSSCTYRIRRTVIIDAGTFPERSLFRFHRKSQNS